MLDLLLLATVAAAPLADDTPLAPTGKWTVDWGDTSCIAFQRYGDGKNALSFAFRPSLDGDVVRLIFSRKGAYQTATHFDVTVGDVKSSAFGFKAAKTDMQVYWIDIARSDFDRLASAPSLKVAGGRLSLDISIKGMAAAVSAIAKCTTHLRAHWNADEAGEARIVTKPVTLVSPWKWVQSDDYPAQASIEGGEGLTQVSLLLDETGAIKDCVIERASGVATLDAQTCIKIRERGKFSAAKGADGKPIKSRVTYRFRWKAA